jgi:membrane protease YdiL (CAAX protease family)
VLDDTDEGGRPEAEAGSPDAEEDARREAERGVVGPGQEALAPVDADAAPVTASVGTGSVGAGERPPGPSRSRVRFAAFLEVIACSGFPTQIAIAGVLALAGLRPFEAQGRLSVPYVFVLSVTDAVLLVGLVVWFLHLHGERARVVLFGQRPLVAESLFGVIQLPAVFGLAVAVMVLARRFAPWLHDVPTNPMEGLIGNTRDAWLFGIVAVVGGGIREEVQRAFVLHRFEQHLGGAWVGLVLFSLVFGAGHVIQGRDVALTTGALGLFWGLVYLRRRSVASTVVSHSCFNALEIVRFAVQRGAGV